MDYVLPFYPPNSPKNENFKKMKKIPGDVIILHKYTTNFYHMVYCSWNRTHDRCNCYFSFWAFFCPFTLLTCLENKNFKKMKKKPWRYHHFTQDHDHMLHCSWDMACDGCNYYFSFWAIFCPFTPLTAQKIKILKEWNLEISSFYTCVPKIMIWWCNIPEKWCTTDGRMDGQTDEKSDTYLKILFHEKIR